jgi:hypothetical protein
MDSNEHKSTKLYIMHSCPRITHDIRGRVRFGIKSDTKTNSDINPDWTENEKCNFSDDWIKLTSLDKSGYMFVNKSILKLSSIYFAQILDDEPNIKNISVLFPINHICDWYKTIDILNIPKSITPSTAKELTMIYKKYGMDLYVKECLHVISSYIVESSYDISDRFNYCVSLISKYASVSCVFNQIEDFVLKFIAHFLIANPDSAVILEIMKIMFMEINIDLYNRLLGYVEMKLSSIVGWGIEHKELFTHSDIHELETTAVSKRTAGNICDDIGMNSICLNLSIFGRYGYRFQTQQYAGQYLSKLLESHQRSDEKYNDIPVRGDNAIDSKSSTSFPPSVN